MNKIINHSQAFIKNENLIIPNDLIFCKNLTAEEQGVLFTLVVFLDENYFSDDGFLWMF